MNVIKWLITCMPKRRYSYIISFSHENGFGNIEIYLSFKISDFEQIKRITEVIKEKCCIKNVVVMNYQLLCVDYKELPGDE